MNKEISLTEKQIEEIRNLREYLINTSKIPDVMNDYIGVPITNMKTMLPNAKFASYGLFLVWVWLGLLHCVIEGWFRLDLHDKKIDKLIGEDIKSRTKYTKDLWTFRNSVFHYHKSNKKEGTPLQHDFLHDDNAMKWAMDLNIEFEKWFDYYFTSNTLPRPVPAYEWFKSANSTKKQRL